MADPSDHLTEGGKHQPPAELLDDVARRDIRTVARGGAVQITGQMCHRIVSFFFTLIAFRFLGKSGYGLYRQVAQILVISGQIGLAGFNYASMRFIALARANKDPGRVRGAARVGITGALMASTIVVGSLLLLSDPLAQQFADDPSKVGEFADLIRLGAAYVPLFALMQVLRYCTQAYKTMVPSVIAGNIVQPLTHFVLGVALLAAGLEVAGALGSLVGAMAMGALAAAFFYFRILKEEERTAPVRLSLGPMVRFALPQAGSSLLGVQTLGVGVLLLGLYGPDGEAGLFGLALALQASGTLFLSGVVNIWAPVVSDLYERGAIDRLGSLYQTLTRWVATFSFPVFAALILEPDLFAVVTGGSGALDAAPVAAILAAGNLFYAGTGPTGYVISMSGRPGINFVNSAVAIALYVFVGAAVASEHGAVGIAVVDACITALINSARVIEARVIVGVQPFGRSFLKPVVATLGGSAALLLWRLIPGDSIPLEIAGVCVAAGVFLLLLRRFGIDPEERYVWQTIRDRISTLRIRK